MKGHNCSSISTRPEHWPNLSWPLIRAINPERGKKAAPEGLLGGGVRGRGRRGEDQGEENKQSQGVRLLSSFTLSD